MLIHNADITGSLTINGVPYTTGSYTGIFIAGTNIMSANTVSLTGSFTGSFFGDGSQLSGVTSYTDADTLDFINSLDVVSGSIQTVSTVSDTFTSVTSYTVTHNFGTKEVIVSVYENDTLIFPSSITTPTTNTVTITFPEPVTGRVVVVKAGHIVSGSINYNSVLNKPTLVSGSSQISFSGITNKPTLVSGSSQITYSGLTGIPSGIVSGSSQVSYSGITNKPSGIVSGSAQVAQFGYAITGSNQFKASQVITGSLTVTGAIVAQTLNVQQVTSSIVFSSGSNIFGNNTGNTHQFTGSVNITGSLNTSIAAFGSAATTFLTSDSGTIRSRTAAQTLSDIAALPLAGGTLTGPLTGSSAVFSDNVIVSSASNKGFVVNSTNGASYRGFTFQSSGTTQGGIEVLPNTGEIRIGGYSTTGDYYPVIYSDGVAVLTFGIGASPSATFSSSVTAGGLVTVNAAGNAVNIIGVVGNPSYYSVDQAVNNAGKRWRFGHTGGIAGFSSFDIYNQTDNVTALTLASTGAATFSSTLAVGTTISAQNGGTLTGSTEMAGILRVQGVGGRYFTTGNGLELSANGIYSYNRGTSLYNDLSINDTITVKGAGNVGIGTTTPDQPLHIVKSSATTNTYVEALHLEGKTTGTVANGFGPSIGFWGSMTGQNNVELAQIAALNTDVAGANGALVFYTRPNATIQERMRITSGGNVSIGNTNNTFKLDVSGTSILRGTSTVLSAGGYGAGLVIQNTNNSAANFSVLTLQANTDGYPIVEFKEGANQKWQIYNDYGDDSLNIFKWVGGAADVLKLSATGNITTPLQPAFRAGRSASYAPGANSNIVFNSVFFNIGSHYNASNGLFTAPIAGRYYFSASVIWESLPDGQEMDDAFTIRANGSIVAYDFRRAEYVAGITGNGGYYVTNANILLNLAANDNVSIRNNRNFSVYGNEQFSWFVGYLLG